MVDALLPTPARPLPSPADGAGARAGSADRQAMHRKAVEFEAIYLSQMLKPMFDNIEAAAPFDGGFGEDMWRSMQLQEFGRAIANAGGVGLADAVYAELLTAQEAQSRGPSR